MFHCFPQWSVNNTNQERVEEENESIAKTDKSKIWRRLMWIKTAYDVNRATFLSAYTCTTWRGRIQVISVNTVKYFLQSLARLPYEIPDDRAILHLFQEDTSVVNVVSVSKQSPRKAPMATKSKLQLICLKKTVDCGMFISEVNSDFTHRKISSLLG